VKAWRRARRETCETGCAGDSDTVRDNPRGSSRHSEASSNRKLHVGDSPRCPKLWHARRQNR
jgi:hypothetical protein